VAASRASELEEKVVTLDNSIFESDELAACGEEPVAKIARMNTPR
jgi:hypothetical protein